MIMLDVDDVVRLLRSEVERAGGPMAYAKKFRVDRATVHRMLKREERPSRKIISALDLRVGYVPKKDKVKANGKAGAAVRAKNGSHIVVVEGDAPIVQINGKPAKAHRAQLAILACLSNELGHVVPYQRLCRVIGHHSCGDRQLRILRQQMLLVRRLLTRHKARCSIAVAAGVGYALCEVAGG